MNPHADYTLALSSCEFVSNPILCTFAHPRVISDNTSTSHLYLTLLVGRPPANLSWPSLVLAEPPQVFAFSPRGQW